MNCDCFSAGSSLAVTVLQLFVGCFVPVVSLETAARNGDFTR